MYRLTHEQLVKSDIEAVWRFFADPRNLQKLTPGQLTMEPRDDLPDEMYEGQLIRYKIRPLAGISLPWTSMITSLSPGSHFIDEQVEGPFKFWHHEHRFEAQGSKTLIQDILHYQLPFGIVGKLFHPLLVRNKLNQIFAFRKRQLNELFGKPYSEQ